MCQILLCSTFSQDKGTLILFRHQSTGHLEKTRPALRGGYGRSKTSQQSHFLLTVGGQVDHAAPTWWQDVKENVLRVSKTIE